MPFSVYTMAWSGEHRAFIVEKFIKKKWRVAGVSGGRRFRRISPPEIFFSGATSKERFTNNVP
jgi:hypothetical protein